MLLELKNKKIQLSEKLILLNKEDSEEKVYIFQRLINPIDVTEIKKNAKDNLKTYLSNNEVSYLAIENKRKIVIYRDLFGLSDIYYHFKNDEYKFSEILSDFYYLGIFDVAIEQYKRIGYIPAPNTIINKVKKIFPGEKIIIDLKLDNIKKIRKSISDIANNKLQYSPETFKESFEQIFEKNISKTNGLLLSGGIDSSLIAYFLSKENNKVPAFTAITKDSKSSIEKERAIKTAGLFCKSHSLIEMSVDLFEKYFVDIFKFMCEPFSDNAILGTSILAKNAYEHGVKTIAEGEGGDELFGHANKIKKYLFIRKFLPN